MSENKRAALDAFLIENGFDITQIPTDVDKLRALRAIAFKADVDKDWDAMLFDKKDKSGLTKEEYLSLRNEHLDRIHNFELVEMNANMYIGKIRFEQKQAKRQKRKESIQKVLSIFSSKKR